VRHLTAPDNLIAQNKPKPKIKIDQTTLQLTGIAVFLLVVMAFLKPDRFFLPINIDSMLLQLAEPGFFALCISLAYLSKGIDLSIVSTANLVGIINGMIIRNNISPTSSNGEIVQILIVCLITGLAVGALCGLFNGFLIAQLGIFPILVTLGTQNLYMGIAMALTQGRAEGNFPAMLLALGNANVFSFKEFLGLPVVTLFFLAVFIIVAIVVHKTPYGLKLQWYGSNSRASYFTGINNKQVIYTTYLLSGLIAALAGMVIMARSNSAMANYGTTYIFQALLTCVLAGISPLGGRGKVYNVLLSLIALQILSTGFNMMRVSPLIRDSLFGFLLVISIILDYILARRRAERLNRNAILAPKASDQKS
jgi:simple sugar transport system permease protein